MLEGKPTVNVSSRRCYIVLKLSIFYPGFRSYTAGKDREPLCHNALTLQGGCMLYSVTQGDGASAFALGCYASGQKRFKLRNPGLIYSKDR